MSVETIVVGADGSEGAERALRWVAEVAAACEAHVIVVHTFEPLHHLTDTAPPLDFAAIEAHVRETLESEWVAPLAEAGVDYETLVLHGTPAEVLLDTVEKRDADLVVVGARGLGRLRGLALGSTSSKVTQAARCPVVIIPPPDDHR